MALKMGKSFFIDAYGKEHIDKLRNGLDAHAMEYVQQMSQMKGPIMKAGQLLASYLGDILSPSAREIFKGLENQSFYLDFAQIKHQIPLEYFKQLEIDPAPFAAASIGQVHKAINKKTGERYALKIQFPGIRKAIDYDLKALKLFIKLFSLVPKDLDLTLIFQEIKSMMLQEMDYAKEVELQYFYSKHIENSPFYDCARPILKFCSEYVITTQLIEKTPLRSPEILNLTNDQRNLLGKKMLELFFLEVFDWGVVHTDAHLGNFFISQDPLQWVLVDFGATKLLEESFQKIYQKVLISLILGNKKDFFKYAEELGDIRGLNSEQKSEVWEILRLLLSPFQIPDNQVYDFGNSSLVEELMGLAPRIMRIPNKAQVNGHSFFLDRKIGNIYHILKHLNCQFNPMDVFRSFL